MIDLSNVGFEPVILVGDGADLPRAGRAFFRGVLYDFKPSTFRPSWRPRGLLCDLYPVDSESGDIDIGRRRVPPFHGTRTDQKFEVRWTSLGSPGLSRKPEIRDMFAGFVEQLVVGKATGAHWDAFVIEHYNDALLEDIRRRCAGMLGGRDSFLTPSLEERNRLLSWARELRGTVAG